MSVPPAGRADREVEQAALVLARGGLVAFPTETVYGLGADASDADALRRLFAVKARPADHPVIVHVARAGQLDQVGRRVPDVARRLAARFWPGALTLVVVRNPDEVDAVATGGLDTVGVRVPDHPIALALLDRFGRGVGAPSANRFGRVSPTTAAAVHAELGADVDLVLDGGPCVIGVESTIVDCTAAPVRVLRVGGVTLEQLTSVLGERPKVGGATRAPGTLPSHYAPRAAVALTRGRDVVEDARAAVAAGHRVAILGVDAHDRSVIAALRGLGPTVLVPVRDERHYARTLYASLRTADEEGVDLVLAVVPPPAGLGAAIADRLRRAAGDGR